MGIPLLNRFLKHKCSKRGIYKVPFNELRDKVIVVDANNFVYRFLSENALLDSFFGTFMLQKTDLIEEFPYLFKCLFQINSSYYIYFVRLLIINFSINYI